MLGLATMETGAAVPAVRPVLGKYDGQLTCPGMKQTKKICHR